MMTKRRLSTQSNSDVKSNVSMSNDCEQNELWENESLCESTSSGASSRCTDTPNMNKGNICTDS